MSTYTTLTEVFSVNALRKWIASRKIIKGNETMENPTTAAAPSQSLESIAKDIVEQCSKMLIEDGFSEQDYQFCEILVGNSLNFLKSLRMLAKKTESEKKA